MDTIVGISTPQGVGAIGIVRMSGMDSKSIALSCFTSRAIPTTGPVPNTMYLGQLHGNGFCEKCMLVYFAAPRSYTGEDVVEIQVHGGITVTQLVLRTLLAGGARMATAGEFTRRAFLNGKVSLSEAEGIMGVINAESQSELNLAYEMMQGSLGKRIQPVVAQLTDVLAMLEAWLDYPDEMEDEVRHDYVPRMQSIVQQLQQLYDTASNGKLVKYGISVAIIGSPNAGKSSLLNSILHEERAIVTPIAGTTRDTLCESVQIDGVRLNLLDTAGLRDTQDTVEAMGVQRAYAAADSADAIIYLLDGAVHEQPDPMLLQRYQGKHLYVVNNKADLQPVADNEYPVLCAKTGEGVDTLLHRIASLCKVQSVAAGVLSEERHIQAVGVALTHCRKALNAVDDTPLDCILVDLRRAYIALGEIDGATATDQLIDRIFASFCVGK